MLDQKNEQKFLKWLYKEYTQRVGYGIRNIDKCPFLTTYSIEHLPTWLCSVNNNVRKSHVVHWAKELEIKGLVRFADNGCEFFFTQVGYETVQRNWWQRLLVWLNKNPGAISTVAIVVSIISLIAAIFL